MQILKSRKFQLLLVGLIVNIIIAYAPELNGSRGMLSAGVDALIIVAMGLHAATDISAIKAQSSNDTVS